MPSKGMRTLLFSPRKVSTSSPSSVSNSNLSNPVRIFSDAIMDRSLLTAEVIIMKWNPDGSTLARVTSLFYGHRSEAREYIKCVNELQKSMHILVAEDPNSKKLVHGKELMEIAMKRLQKEFYQILSMNRAHLDPESMSARSSGTLTGSSVSDIDEDDDDIHAIEDSIIEVEDVSNMAMDDLKSIAECMISCGYGKECVTIYKLIRKSIIDEGIYKLGVQKLSFSHVHKMDWDTVELKIKTWLEAVKILIKTLFNGEKILCDHVFSSSKNIKELCFTDISREGAHILFTFPEIVAKSSKNNPKKLFRLLDMCVVISDNWPMIDSIFSFESSSTIHSQAINSLITVREFVRTRIIEFENFIKNNASKMSVASGGIHPLTTQVVDYLIVLADYTNVLTDILEGYSPPSSSSLSKSLSNASDSESSEASIISQYFRWLILILLCKLDAKAKNYKDVSLAYLFLANNIQHVIIKVRTSNLKFILGNDWHSEQEIKVKQFAGNFERLGWDNVANILLRKPTIEMSVEEVTKWVTRFKSAFELAHRKQSLFVISDKTLRDEIKGSIANKIVPIYRGVYNTHKVALLERSSSANVVKFTPESVEYYLTDMYFMTGGSGASVSPSSGSFELRTYFG